MQKVFTLFLHVGAGKTGSTAIQQSLKKSGDELKAAGCIYFGLMLENAPVKKFDWQDASKAWAAGSIFNKKSGAEKKDSEILTILAESIEILKSRGIYTGVWSNEAFFGVSDAFSFLPEKLKAINVDLKVVCYVRAHDAWAKSAYLQWGIKHKTYSGPLLSFADYVKNRPVRFHKDIESWQLISRDNLVLRNYDAVQDVVLDMLANVGLGIKIKSGRENKTPGLEELFLRAVYANSQKESVLPGNFDELFGFTKVKNIYPNAWLQNLLPKESDINTLWAECSEDICKINQILENNGQPGISRQLSGDGETSLNMNLVTSMLFQVVINQSQKINSLSQDIKELKDQVSTLLGNFKK